jgi:hypothetical protein
MSKLDLIEALLSIHHYGSSQNKPAVAKLKASKHILASGKPSKSGREMIERWYAPNSNRDKLLKEMP